MTVTCHIQPNHITIGDKLTVNILGRDIEAQVAALRQVRFSSGGIGFVLTMNRQALATAQPALTDGQLNVSGEKLSSGSCCSIICVSLV